MAVSIPGPAALLNEQLAAAPFPCWLVNGKLDVLTANEAARTRHLAHCLPDGMRLFLAPADSDAVVDSLAAGVAITKRPLLLFPYGAALAFTPIVPQGDDSCALVLLVPVSELTNGESEDPRRQLEGVGSMVVTQGIRRCMTDIFAALGTASDQLHSTGVREVDSQLALISHSCYRMLRTADNLSRNIQVAANLVGNSSAINFWDSCAELLDAAETLLRTGKHAFSYTLPDSQVYVNCNFEQITSAVLNLVSNSYLYGGEGVAVVVTGRDVAGRVLLTITDNGPGISPGMQERLFQPFCSWDSLEKSNAGVGLGLHLVRALVTAAGGSVSINTDDSGTTVAISLPTAPPPDRPLALGSSSRSYLLDRYSPLYLALCDVVAPPRC